MGLFKCARDVIEYLKQQMRWKIIGDALAEIC